jgi:hypothetical protein
MKLLEIQDKQEHQPVDNKKWLSQLPAQSSEALSDFCQTLITSEKEQVSFVSYL